MRLLQVNVLGHQHVEKITALVTKENPDVICLQEADKFIIEVLDGLGYMVHFLPLLKRSYGEETIEEGIVLAARELQSVKNVYYFMPGLGIQIQDHARHRDTTAHGYIMGEIVVEDVTYNIASTHFAWSPRGEIACPSQQEDMESLLKYLSQEKPHILCGDFNIPRLHNPLYNELIKHYTDSIPPEYKSSLDKKHHRMGGVLSRSHLFTDFMVDYIFSQPPYEVSNVQLHFGVSDHAAVTADVKKVGL